jgi:hypothetical protein
VDVRYRTRAGHREELEDDPTVTFIVVSPEECLELDELIREHGRLEIVHRVPSPVDDASFVYVRCEDEWQVEGFERP